MEGKLLRLIYKSRVCDGIQVDMLYICGSNLNWCTMEILLLKDMRLKLTAVLGILFLVVSCQRQPEEVFIPVLPLDLTSATSVPYQVVRTD